MKALQFRLAPGATLTAMLLSLALFLGIAQATSAATVVYSITSDDLVLNNANGSWGGDLNVGAGQAANITVAYWYQGNPSEVVGNHATFLLEGLQEFDNTNRLASDFIKGTGSISFAYNYYRDWDTAIAASSGRPGGFFIVEDSLQLGEPGDPLPVGEWFDRRMERTFLELVAFAPDYASDYIFASDLPDNTALVDNFTFQSRVVPIPAAVWLFSSALLGMISMGRRRRS